MQTNCHLGEMDAWYSERRKPKFCKRRSLQSRNLFLGFFLVRQVVSACNCMITQEHFKLLAAYNRWANARLYAAALDLSELSYRLHTGVYFGIDSSRTIVQIVANRQVNATTNVQSAKPVIAMLEINAGVAAKLGIAVGDTVTLANKGAAGASAQPR